MISLKYTVLLCILAPVLYGQSRFDVTMTVDSVPRQFIVVKPSGVPPSEGYPIVFMFHGTSGDGEKFYNISGWKEKGEAEKFISVFPSSLEYCVTDSGRQHRTTKWHTGELEELACPGQYLKDDVAFVRKMIDTIRAVFPIDRRRIFASGFSNGGGFVSKLAMEMSEVFAAIGASGGALNSGDSTKPTRSIPYWFTLGTNDATWLEHYTITEFPFNDTALVYLRVTLQRCLGAFGLTQDYTKTENPLVLTYQFVTPSGQDPTTEFRFSLVNGLEHQYPNGTNVPYAIANPLWDFFKSHPLSITTIEEHSAPSSFGIYPNPASDFLIIEGKGEMDVTLRTILGQSVYSTRVHGGQRIHLPRLTPGTYIAEAVSGRTISHRILRIQ